jgi:hypothetical protein
MDNILTPSFFTKIDGSVKLVFLAIFYNPTLYKQIHGTTTQTMATNNKTKPKQIFPKMKTKSKQWSETCD